MGRASRAAAICFSRSSKDRWEVSEALESDLATGSPLDEGWSGRAAALLPISSAFGGPEDFDGVPSSIRKCDWHTGQVTSAGWMAGLDGAGGLASEACPWTGGPLLFGDEAAGCSNSARAIDPGKVLGAGKGMRSSPQHFGQWMTSPPQARSHSMCWPQEGHSNLISLTMFPP